MLASENSVSVAKKRERAQLERAWALGHRANADDRGHVRGGLANRSAQQCCTQAATGEKRASARVGPGDARLPSRLTLASRWVTLGSRDDRPRSPGASDARRNSECEA
jgi:hypothetical protein